MVRQFFQVVGDVLRLQTVLRSSRLALKPCNRAAGPVPVSQASAAAIPALFEIEVVIRVWNADPAHQRRLNPFARAVGEVQIANTLRSQQPLMTRARSDVDQFCFDIRGNNAECLDCVHDEQSVVLPRERVRGVRDRYEIRMRTGRD